MQVKIIAECPRGAFCNTLTFIKLPFVIKILVLSNFEWTFYTGFTAATKITYNIIGPLSKQSHGKFGFSYLRFEERIGSVVVFDLVSRGPLFENHLRNCARYYYFILCLVLVQPRKTGKRSKQY